MHCTLTSTVQTGLYCTNTTIYLLPLDTIHCTSMTCDVTIKVIWFDLTWKQWNAKFVYIYCGYNGQYCINVVLPSSGSVDWPVRSETRIGLFQAPPSPVMFSRACKSVLPYCSMASWAACTKSQATPWKMICTKQILYLNLDHKTSHGYIFSNSPQRVKKKLC